LSNLEENISGSIFADLSSEDVKELGLKFAGRKLVTAAVERVIYINQLYQYYFTTTSFFYFLGK